MHEEQQSAMLCFFISCQQLDIYTVANAMVATIPSLTNLRPIRHLNSIPISKHCKSCKTPIASSVVSNCFDNTDQYRDTCVPHVSTNFAVHAKFVVVGLYSFFLFLSLVLQSAISSVSHYSCCRSRSRRKH